MNYWINTCTMLTMRPLERSITHGSGFLTVYLTIMDVRAKNLEDNQVILEKLMADVKWHPELKKIIPRTKMPKYKHRKSETLGPIRRNPSRRARVGDKTDPRNPRRYSDPVMDLDSSPTNRLQVRFGFFKKSSSLETERDSEDERDEPYDEEEFVKPRISNHTKSFQIDTRSADEITDDDLALVADGVSDKRYDSIYGTSCHQCRQKTNDMKTICRSGACFGVRGQNWHCPPCRGICNCSFCRKKQGKSCTGIMIHMARFHGFDSVKDYLQSSSGSGGSTPVMDEPTYHEEESQEGMDVEKAGSDIGSPRNRDAEMDDDYVSDGGEVEREEVERDDDEGPASPASGPASPDGSNPASPAGPLSPTESDGPRSPNDYGPASPEPEGPASPTVGVPPGLMKKDLCLHPHLQLTAQHHLKTRGQHLQKGVVLPPLMDQDPQNHPDPTGVEVSHHSVVRVDLQPEAEVVHLELIADIFGSSDEDEEFEGFEEADVEAAKKKKEKKKGKESKAVVSDDEDGAGVTGQVENQEVVPDISSDEEGVNKDDIVSDFDLMLMRKKEEMRKRKKRRRDVDIINDNDDLIADMIVKMKEAAEDDRELNMRKKPAITKLKMLGHVVSQLKKADLHSAFLDCGVLSAMTEWLAPLPDKSLPHLQIREQFLRILHEFPAISQEGLKASGIGKAVMYLYKHPRETKLNKDRAGKLINEWSRPIFNLTSNFKMLSKQEREERDYEQLPKKRRVSAEGMTPRRDINNALAGEDKVPMPSHKDYVVRPKWGVDEGQQGKSSGKKAPTRYDKHVRAFAEKKKFSKAQRAVTISIEGRNMAL
uniref:IWS1-like protein n=1 Tax=Magallana gigas TaxID=29159 RepID=K1R853_MAGGI